MAIELGIDEHAIDQGVLDLSREGKVTLRTLLAAVTLTDDQFDRVVALVAAKRKIRANLKAHEDSETIQVRYDAARARIEARGWTLGGQDNYPENLFTPDGRCIEVPDCPDAEAEIAILEHWARTLEETDT